MPLVVGRFNGTHIALQVGYILADRLRTFLPGLAVYHQGRDAVSALNADGVFIRRVIRLVLNVQLAAMLEIVGRKAFAERKLISSDF